MALTWVKSGLVAALACLVLLGGCSDSSAPDSGSDRRRIAFASDRGGDEDIWVMRADGSGLLNLTQSPGTDSEPAWSPDGALIAFVSNRTGHRELFVMDTLGGHQIQITNRSQTVDRPTWAPDGQRLMFSADGILHTLSPTGQDTTEITANSGQEPAWNPHAARVAIGGGGACLGLIDTNGTNMRLAGFCKPSTGSYTPAWSPTGSRLVFTRLGAGLKYSLIINDTLNSNEFDLTQHLAPSQATGVTQPAWSHDGRDIAFTCNTSTDEFNPQFDLCLIHPDGSGFRRLTHDAASDTWPTWAP